MNKSKIWLSSPHMGGNEQKYVQEAFNSNWIAPLGHHVDGLEEDLEAYLEAPIFVGALSSGTAAIHLGLILLGITKGDEVIVQTHTHNASVNPIIYQGATPVFIDSERETWNMCPKALEEAIVDRIAKGKKPKAIIAVHLYGMPYKVDAIKAVANKYAIPILEDAAEALGSSYSGQKCGTFGDIGVLSFNGNKIITTSGGGAIVTKTKELKDKAIFFATQSRDKAPHYQHSEIGYNYRMSNICAGIGRGQMEVLESRVLARRANFDFYQEQFKEIPDLSFLEEPKGFYANRWLTCVLTPSFEVREKIRWALEKENIESRPLWKPMHQQPVFQQYPAYLNGVSDDLFERGLCLPSGSNLSEQDLLRVVYIIKTIVNKP